VFTTSSEETKAIDEFVEKNSLVGPRGRLKQVLRSAIGENRIAFIKNVIGK